VLNTYTWSVGFLRNPTQFLVFNSSLRKQCIMAFSKANRYNTNEQIVNHYTRAISYPARQEILKKLFKDGPCTVNELRKNHPISRATFSDHLKNLRASQLISCKEVFPSTYYTMDMEKFNLARKYITDFFDFFGNLKIDPE